MGAGHDEDPAAPVHRDLLTRRSLLAGSLGSAAFAVAGLPASALAGGMGETLVTTLAVGSYDHGLTARLGRALRGYPEMLEKAVGGTVLLKPNMVDFDPVRPINTDPRLVLALAQAFLRLGARRVVVGEAPGHRRDTELLLEGSGLGPALRDLGLRFVDLNLDAVVEVPLLAPRSRLESIPLASTALAADLLVSVPRMKTHHWTGITLSLKNLFGLVPGSAMGWPKNPLHWAGIHECIADVWSVAKPGFAVVDGLVGMEGDGPLMGAPVSSRVVVMGDDLAAVDATCARLMGMDPMGIRHLKLVRNLGGVLSRGRIRRAGDQVAARPYRPAPGWEDLALD